MTNSRPAPARPPTKKDRAIHFTRDVVIPEEVDGLLVNGEYAWLESEARRCANCGRRYVLADIPRGRPPRYCSPECWLVGARRIARDSARRAFIRRGAQVTPRDLSEAGVDGANHSHHLLPGVIGTLHDLACHNDPCVCMPVFVREVAAVEQAFEVKSGYHGEVDHRLESRRLGAPAHPGRRAVPRSTEVSP